MTDKKKQIPWNHLDLNDNYFYTQSCGCCADVADASTVTLEDCQQLEMALLAQLVAVRELYLARFAPEINSELKAKWEEFNAANQSLK